MHSPWVDGSGERDFCPQESNRWRRARWAPRAFAPSGEEWDDEPQDLSNVRWFGIFLVAVGALVTGFALVLTSLFLLGKVVATEVWMWATFLNQIVIREAPMALVG